ncbi:MAG TPA: glycine cleavage system protein H [Thermoplasmata archaeon]|nr:glycine cleavage system protein H [Thermoplasmata archaeon]
MMALITTVPFVWSADDDYSIVEIEYSDGSIETVGVWEDEGVRYTTDHYWMDLNEDRFDDYGYYESTRIGISDYAENRIGRAGYVYILPNAKNIWFPKGEYLGYIEGSEGKWDLHMSVSGTIKRVNKNTIDSPELINDDIYGDSWLYEVSFEEPDDILFPSEVSIREEETDIGEVTFPYIMTPKDYMEFLEEFGPYL